MRWPLYMTVFLAVMTGVIYAIDPRAGIVAGIATAVYGLAAVAAYTYSRPVVHKELVSLQPVWTDPEAALERAVYSLCAFRRRRQDSVVQ